MGPSFDPYYKGSVPPEEQPPNHYRLLEFRISRRTPTDPSRRRPADGASSHVPDEPICRMVAAALNEVAAAKIRLLNPAKSPPTIGGYGNDAAELAAGSAAFAVVVDKPRLHLVFLAPQEAIAVAHHWRVLAMSVVAAGLRWVLHRTRRQRLRKNGQPIGRNDQNTARVKKRRQA